MDGKCARRDTKLKDTPVHACKQTDTHETGLVWSSLVWSSMVWSGLVLSGRVVSGLVLSCLVVSCLGRCVATATCPIELGGSELQLLKIKISIRIQTPFGDRCAAAAALAPSS